MLRYRGAGLIKAGFVGSVLLILVTAVGLQPQQLWLWATSVRYQALFSEAGGLTVGNAVKVSGVKVGQITDISLRELSAMVTFTVDADVLLGSDTTAHIRTGSLLGERIMTLESAGRGNLHPSQVIPLARTSSPYSLTDALGDLTTSGANTNTEGLNQSLDTLSATLDQIAPQLGPAFDGLTKLSRSLNERDHTLEQLLQHTRDVAGVLGQRSQQLNALILDGNDLLDVLVARRRAIADLLNNTSAVAQQLSALVHDNQQKLAPTLDKLNAVTAMLQRNSDNIAKALPGVAKYAITLGETVSNGPYYTAFVPNIAVPELVQPFLDYAFGFRRGTNAGQPPDQAGPRAEVPFPVNGIPQPGERWPR